METDVPYRSKEKLVRRILWVISSVGRTPALQAGCHGFESHMYPLCKVSFDNFILLAHRNKRNCLEFYGAYKSKAKIISISNNYMVLRATATLKPY